jgi:hypothetical protein
MRVARVGLGVKEVANRDERARFDAFLFLCGERLCGFVVSFRLPCWFAA